MLSPELTQSTNSPSRSLIASMKKTVGFVLKNGDNFQKKLLENDKDGLFKFLDSTDENHQVYVKLLEKAKKLETKQAEKAPQSLDQPKRRVTDLSFIHDMPPMRSQDMRIMRFTAQTIASNGDDYGKGFLNHVVKSGRIEQFAFLRPNHTYYPLYKNYLDWYKGLLDYSGIANSPLEERVLQVLEYTEATLLGHAFDHAANDLSNRRRKQDEDAQKMAKEEHYSSIDWQSFVFAARVNFDAVDEVSEMAAPLTLEEVMSRSLASKNKDLELKNIAVQSKEQVDVVNFNEELAAADEPMLQLNHGGPTGISGHKPNANMKIKAKGETRLKRLRPKSKSYILCPFTGEKIPEDEFDAHLSTILRDPRYQDQQDNYMRKNFTYVSKLTTEQVYENIKNLVRNTSMARSEEEEQALAKRSKLD